MVARILVVETNSTALKLFQLFAQTHDLDCVGCQTYDQAKSLLLSGEVFSIVFMDWRQPFMDRLEFLRLIRKIDQATERETPVIGMSVQFTYLDRPRCLHAGMNDFFRKPFTGIQLRSMVRKWQQADPNHPGEQAVG